MKKIVIVVFAILLFPAQFTSIVEADELRNGRNWNTWSNVGKLNYIYGYLDAMVQGYGDIGKKMEKKDLLEMISNEFPMKGKIPETCNKLNEFYSQDDNIVVPISYAIKALARKEKGEEQVAKEIIDNVKKAVSQNKP